MGAKYAHTSCVSPDLAHPTQRRSPRDTPTPGVTRLGQLPFITLAWELRTCFRTVKDDEARLIVARLRASPPARQAVLLDLRERSYSVILTGEDRGSVPSLLSCRVVECRGVEWSRLASLVKVKRARESTFAASTLHHTQHNIVLQTPLLSRIRISSLSLSLSHTLTHSHTERLSDTLPMYATCATLSPSSPNRCHAHSYFTCIKALNFTKDSQP